MQARQVIWIKIMSASTLPFERLHFEAERGMAVPQTMQRTKGMGRISFKLGAHSSASSVLDELYQEGAAKIRLPNVYGDMAEAALINTSGGVTGGDELSWNVHLHPHTKAVLTTQACEKIYKSSAEAAQISNRLQVDDNAELHWLPQETILFNRASLSRRLEVDLALSARLLAVEAVILGRHAMGEAVQWGHFKDTWRVRKAGKLVHADDVLLSGSVAQKTRRAAVLNGAGAFASVLYVGPEDEELLKAMSKALQRQQDSGVTAISAIRGKLVARVLAPDGFALRKALIPLLQGLREGRDLPKLWNL